LFACLLPVAAKFAPLFAYLLPVAAKFAPLFAYLLPVAAKFVPLFAYLLPVAAKGSIVVVSTSPTSLESLPVGSCPTSPGPLSFLPYLLPPWRRIICAVALKTEAPTVRYHVMVVSTFVDFKNMVVKGTFTISGGKTPSMQQGYVTT
jgi:hypothetical protein